MRSCLLYYDAVNDDCGLANCAGSDVTQDDVDTYGDELRALQIQHL